VLNDDVRAGMRRDPLGLKGSGARSLTNGVVSYRSLLTVATGPASSMADAVRAFFGSTFRRRNQPMMSWSTVTLKPPKLNQE